jgi:predicted XRE-type DNA-binding protein
MANKLEYDSIFDAITDNAGESADLQFRADMMLLLRNYFEAKKWSQTEIGQKLEIPQPRVSDLVRGKIQHVSADKLICYLRKIGYAIRPHIETPKKGRAPVISCEVQAV